MAFKHTFILLSLITQVENKTEFCVLCEIPVSDRIFNLIQIENEDCYKSLQLISKIYDSMLFYRRSKWKYQNKWADQLEVVLSKILEHSETTHIQVEW